MSFSLGVEPVDRDVMTKPPRDVKQPIITRSLLLNVVTSAMIIVMGTLWVFWREVWKNRPFYFLFCCQLRKQGGGCLVESFCLRKYIILWEIIDGYV